jgi:hypothetical protein
VSAEEQIPVREVAKTLGLPENASREQVLAALKALKPAPAATKPGVDDAAAQKATADAKYEKAAAPRFREESKWQLRTDALFLFRDEHNTTQDYARNTLVPGTPVVLDSEKLDSGIAPGIRLSLGYALNDKTEIEGTYFGLQDWSECAAASDPAISNGLDTVNSSFGAVNGFIFADRQKISFESSLHSGEINVHQYLGNMMSLEARFIGGLRYVDVSEGFRYSSYVAEPATPADVAWYETKTHNRLLGLQAGADLKLPLAKWAELNLQGKLGLMANFSSSEAKLYDLGPQLVYKDQQDATSLAGMVDVEAGFLFRPHKNVNVSVGYKALWITGLGLAQRQRPETLDFALSHPLTHSEFTQSDDLLFHGPWVGLTFRW